MSAGDSLRQRRGRGTLRRRRYVLLAIAACYVLTATSAEVVASGSAQSAQAPPALVDGGLTEEHVGHLRWRELGPSGVGGRIVDLAVVEADPDVIFVATAQAGVWRTDDGGVHWRALMETATRSAVGGLAVSQSNPNLVWAGTGEPNGRNLVSTSWGDGVYKSADGGKTWTNMGLADSQQIGRIRIDPRDDDVVWVSVVGSLWHDSDRLNAARGLWLTRDGGLSWTKVLDAGAHAGFVDVDLDPRDPDIVYAAAWQRERRDWSWLPRGDGGGLWRSLDGGETWQQATQGFPTNDLGRVGVSVCRSQPDTVYAVAEGPQGGLFRSDDRGASWERRTDEVSASQYYGQVRCDPVDPQRVYVLSTLFHVSHDGGATFANEMQGKPVHVDHHALWIDPADSQRLVLGNDGGVYLSADRGAHWRFMDNLPITQFYEIGVDMTAPFYNVYGGTQDNNTYGAPVATRNRSGIVADDWFLTIGGDGFYARADPEEPWIVYTEWQNGNLARFDTRTGQRTSIKPLDPPGCDADDAETACYRWNWSAPVHVSNHDPRTLYFGANVVFRSADRGDSWEVISPDLTQAITYDNPMNDYGTVRVIAESPLRRGLLAVGTDDGLIQISEDDGAVWRRAEALPGVPARSLVRRLVLSAHDERTLYVASSGHEYNDFAPYVLRSSDLGQSWQSIVGNLPDGSPVRAFAEHPAAPGVLFVGTEHGVWFSADDGGSWVSLQRNLPTVAVHDLVVHPRDGDLVVGTHGRGIWVLDDVASLTEIAAAVSRPAWLFPVRAAYQVSDFDRGRRTRGDAYWSAANPPRGAFLDVWLAAPAASEDVPQEPAPEARLVVHDAEGAVVRTLVLENTAGTLRQVWDLRHDDVWRDPEAERSIAGPWVVPGRYEVELQVGGVAVADREIEVREDPIAPVAPSVRVAWRDEQLRLGRWLARQRTVAAAVDHLRDQARAAQTVLNNNDGDVDDLGTDLETLLQRIEDVRERSNDLGRLAGRTYGALQGAVGPPTADQVAVRGRLAAELPDLVEAINLLIETELPALGARLDRAGIAWSPGRAIPATRR